MVTTIRTLEPFVNGYDSSSDNKERMGHFFLENGIKEVKEKSVLLAFVRTKTYKLIKSLLVPTKLSEKSFQQLVKVVQEHCTEFQI